MISIFLADEDWNILLSLSNFNKKQGQSQGKYITNICMPLFAQHQKQRQPQGSICSSFLNLQCRRASSKSSLCLFHLGFKQSGCGVCTTASLILAATDFGVSGESNSLSDGPMKQLHFGSPEGQAGVFMSLHYHYLILQHSLLLVQCGD